MKPNVLRLLRLVAPILAIVASGAIGSACAAGSKAASPGVYYSESMGVKTPDEHITGSTSSRDAQGAPLQKEQALLDKVMTALVGNPQLEGADLHVNVEGNKVGITGHARDAAQARYARDAAQAAAGTAAVDSRVTTG